ncbi:major histocompatibility complex class I-related gene protein, partial [Latimeria chalumnae]
MTANSVTRGLHSWRFFETVIVGPDEQKQFIALGTLDNVPVVYYDSNIRRSVPKQPWVEEVAANAEGRRYWNELTQRLADRKRRLTHWVRELKLMKNKTTDIYTYQELYGCDLHDNGTTVGFWWYSSDGDTCNKFDSEQERWIALTGNDHVVNQNCNSDQEDIAYTKKYLNEECISWLKICIKYGNETLGRKVCPEVKIYYRQDLDKKSFSVVCMATGFYPPAINVTWVCEGVRQTNVSTTSGILPKEDGTYQITEEIKVGLEEKRSYACHV